jgi:hypothetical protein
MIFTSIKYALSIDCGENTCESRTGNSCTFLAVRRNKEAAACLCNRLKADATLLSMRNEWILRTKECMETFQKSVDEK